MKRVAFVSVATKLQKKVARVFGDATNVLHLGYKDLIASAQTLRLEEITLDHLRLSSKEKGAAKGITVTNAQGTKVLKDVDGPSGYIVAR